MSIDWSKPIQTRAGRPARVICADRADALRPVVVLIRGESGDELVASVTRAGTYRTTSAPDGADIINVPEPVEYWTNIYQTSNGAHFNSPLFTSAAVAAQGAAAHSSKCLRTLKLTITGEVCHVE
jgi:hypothetical protein